MSWLRHSCCMSSSDPIAARPEVEVFADLQSLCASPGYAHTIGYFCWRDNLIRYGGSQVTERDLEHQHSHDKLLRTEISTLIGLMIQQPIDLSLPAPDVMQDYVDRTESLLHELHQSLQKPWFEGLSLETGDVPERDTFATAAAMREPIFYGGELAYDFQYRDLARLKYRADDEWLEANKGFRIEDACRIADALLELQLTRQRECAQSLQKIPPDEWTMLPGLMFTRHFPGSAGSMARMLLLGAQGNAQKAPRRPRMGRRRAPSAWRTHPALVSWEFVGSRAHFACGIAGHVGVLAHAGSGGGRGRRSSIRRRMSANSARGTATSASWNTT